jgi:hypothetical protein
MERAQGVQFWGISVLRVRMNDFSLVAGYISAQFISSHGTCQWIGFSDLLFAVY